MDSTGKTIGVFDSGFGGLTVLKALLELMPAASYLYFGDTARLPYGSKSAETVARYAVDATRFLEQQGVDMLVIACNTATALALDQIKAAAHVPVLGVIEPGAESASAMTNQRRVVVIGTEATVSSHAYHRALAAHDVEAREKACPLLVPLVEEGWIDHPVTERVARIYLEEAFAADFATADVLLLGCTHYPLLRRLLGKVAPAHVTIVDSAESTARAVAETLAIKSPAQAQLERGILEIHGSTDASLRFFATDSTEKFQRLGTQFLGRPIPKVTHIDLKE